MTQLTDRELQWLRFLTEEFERGERYTCGAKVPALQGLDRAEIRRMHLRMTQFGLIEIVSSEGDRITDEGRQCLSKLDNPPPKDYWAGLVTWFRSKWWSVPLVLLIVVAPALVKWVEMLITLLRSLFPGE